LAVIKAVIVGFGFDETLYFAGVVGTLAKLAKTMTLRITTNKLYFILSERLVNGGVGIWCEILQVSGNLYVCLRTVLLYFCKAHVNVYFNIRL